MFCLERDALQLSHPRQKKPYPGQAGPLWPLPGSPPGVLLSASDLHCASKGTLSWCAGCHPSWEVIPNRDKLAPSVGSWLHVELERVSSQRDGGWPLAAAGHSRQANRCGSVPHKLVLTGPGTPSGGLTPTHMYVCNDRHTHTHNTDTYGWLGGPAVYWNNRKHHGCQHFSILIVCFCVLGSARSLCFLVFSHQHFQIGAQSCR